tara:strand:- start:842 stop:1315 length:474 start_codon:yes stop_codon:yes gene_type:complete
MLALQQLGFAITRTHTGEFKVSKDPLMIPETEDLLGEGKTGRGRGTAAPVEETQQNQGEPHKQRPSDIGGMGQGSPSSGTGTSMSDKSSKKDYDGINPANFEIVKSILQDSVDFGWKKTKTVNTLRKSAIMTVRQAREIVNKELGQTRRWEDDSEKE